MKIPFSIDENRKELAFLDFGNSFYNNKHKIIYYDNFEFVSKIKILSYSESKTSKSWNIKIFDVQSAPTDELIEFLNNCDARMFSIDFMNFIKTSNLFCGESVFCHWTFVQRGNNFGIKLNV